ncbi:polysaccharide pyruvyl transferase family protein [Thalassococcus sp. BH17M4-6]|uniref:polysaccharide pyruvyl transferase family protein n=1 Tax=Thalassococcus sp. BH17M4-6 TaxID=3413148 RepID=UPI003BD00CC4
MYSNPFFISPATAVPDLGSDTTLNHMRAVGLNTGNMLFSRALQKVLAPTSGTPVSSANPKDLLKVHKNHDSIVLAAANWLQPRTDLGDRAAVIEQTDLPCFVIGIGAQSGSVTRIPELTEGTKRFLKVVSERSAAISVRGAFTAEVLAHYGIHNVEITGCPSLLMMDPVPPKLNGSATPPTRISISGSRGLPSEAQLTAKSPTHRLSRLFAKLIQTDDVDFVAQAEIPEINLILEGITRDEPHREEWLRFAEQYYGMPLDQLTPLLRKRMKVFFNLPDWLDYLGSRDFVIGTRLHGAIAGLLAGTPSVLIVHDSRTREMAENMAIPAIEASRITDSIPYAEIYQEANFDRFNLGYMTYYHRFRAFFERNRLNHALNPNA